LRHLQSIISNWKNALVSPEAARQLASNDHEVLAAHAYLSYEATLKAYQAMDFDDLIGLPVKLFTEHPEIKEKVAEPFALLCWSMNIRTPTPASIKC
jgi:ATP-dependent DNA helicase Rep